MAQKTLDAVIRLMGKTEPSFTKLGTAIENLGTRVNVIGGKIAEMEKESVDVYRNYENQMLAAKYALSAQYKTASDLNRAMESLEEYAQQWASTTIFHTDDVSKAINEAAHAGWNYEKILEGIPRAMLIAQAGGLDLSTGLDYLIKMMNATDSSFDDMEQVVNQWSKAANLSATNIDEMGEAFMSLSSSAMFADSTQELFTMIALLSNAGVTGSRAGTLLRNAMMRMIGPTQQARKAMAALGADEDEINELMEQDSEWSKMLADQLKSLGFSAFDVRTGELKPMLQIFESLHDALKDMNEQQRYDILSKIFPLRSINAATTFYKAIEKGNMAFIFEEIGNSEGYAAKGAEIMMSGLEGSIQRLESKWEDFELKVGEHLAPSIENIAGFLGNIVDGLNNMDPILFDSLVSGLTGIAAAGAGLEVAGGAIKLLGTLGPVGGTLLVLSFGVGALASAVNSINEQNFKAHFGNLPLDLQQLGEDVEGLGNKLTENKQAIAEWEEALAGVQQTYESASANLAETLLMKLIGGGTVTQGDETKINGYVESIEESVTNGIKYSKARRMTLLEALFGDAKPNSEESNVYQTAVEAALARYSALEDEAYQIGEELRSKMTEALRDKTINAEEQAAIDATLARYNKIMAEVSSMTDKAAYYTRLHKADKVSWDSIEGFMQQNSAAEAAALAELEDQYDELYGFMEASYRRNLENGTWTEDEFKINWAGYQQQHKNEYEAARQSVIAQYGEVTARAFDALLRGTDFADAWEILKKGTIDEEGGIDYTKAFEGMNATELRAASNLLNTAAETLGMMHIPQNLMDYPAFARLTELFSGAGGAALQAQEVAAALSTAETERYNELKAREIELANEQSGLDAMRKRSEEIDRELQQIEDWTNQNKYTASDSEMEKAARRVEALLSEKNSIEIDIKTNEDYIDRLQQKIDKLTKEQTIRLTFQLGLGGGSSGNTEEEVGFYDEYANGGRATQASIFGEGGPEWAIPEEHSERTARLLDEARRASGFTWGDLLSRYGGLNAGTGGSVTVNYAPVITAGNAEGIDSVLAADKERLKRVIAEAMREQKFLDRMTVYA